jgi:hypothetical protein
VAAIPSLSLAFLTIGCSPDRYLCGPGTHPEGDWCVVDAADTGGGADDSGRGSNDSAADSGKGDSGDSGGGDSGGGDSGGDTADSGPVEEEPAKLVLNEYIASNDSAAQDENGDYDDFVEVFNAGGKVAMLEEYALTDDAENLAQYTFPSGERLPPGEWVVIWADAEVDEGDHHAAFTLTSAGDRVFLIHDPSGAAEVSDSVEFSELATDTSMARIPDGEGDWAATTTVTPGEANQP